MEGSKDKEGRLEMWFESLPEQCPEEGQRTPDGEVFYRLVRGSSIECNDFWSHRKLWPHKTFNTTECRACAVSIFHKKEQCERLLLLPLHEHKKIAAVTLTKDAGSVKQTGSQDGHHSWWRSKNFEPTLNAMLI